MKTIERGSTALPLTLFLGCVFFVWSSAEKLQAAEGLSESYAGIQRVRTGFDDTAKDSIVFVARYEGQTDLPGPQGAIRWERFQVLRKYDVHEESQVVAMPSVRQSNQIPASVRRPDKDEILVAYNVDGGYYENRSPTWPKFVSGKTYVLLLPPNSELDFYGLLFGRDGVYEIRKGRLIPSDLGKDNLIAADISARFNSRLDLLESACRRLEKMRRRKSVLLTQSRRR